MVFRVYPPPALPVGQTQLPARPQARFQLQLRIWLPVLLSASVFAVESTSCFGADHTSAPLQRLAEAIFGYDVCVHWDLIHHLIRKTGHFAGYGIFSLVCFRSFWLALQNAASRLRRRLQAHGLAILATFLVASADEFHQSFLPNRTGQFSDVLLDTCGAAMLGLALFLAMQVAAGYWQADRRKLSGNVAPVSRPAVARVS
jgi:VanZ family protein